MKRTFLIITMMLFAFMQLQGQEKNFIDQNYIEVSARAELEVSPDEIFVQIIISEKDSKAKNNLEQKERDLFKALKTLGIDLNKDLQIQDISSSLKEYMLKKDQILSSKKFILKLKGTDQLLKLYKSTEELGVPDLTIIRTEVSDMQEQIKKVMVKASEKAFERASLLAQSSGRKIGKVIYIQCYENFPVTYRGDMMVKSTYNFANEAAPEEMPVLQFEKIKLEQSVVVRYTLE